MTEAQSMEGTEVLVLSLLKMAESYRNNFFVLLFTAQTECLK